MARPRTPIGTFGDIDFTTLGPERVRARTRVRDFDGQVRRVEATASSRKLAEHRLKEKLAQRATRAGGSRQLTPDSSFKELVEVWLADLDLEGGLAPSTRALYERNMRQLVMPAFEHYTPRGHDRPHRAVPQVVGREQELQLCEAGEDRAEPRAGAGGPLRGDSEEPGP